MKNLRELFEEWQKIDKEVDEFVAKLKLDGVQGTKGYEQAMKQKFGTSYPGFWKDVIVNPVAEQIKVAGDFQKVEVLGPFGLGCRVHVVCYLESDDEIEKAKSLLVSPVLDEDAETPLLLVDVSKRTGRYEQGTVGYVNGLDYVTTPIDPKTSGEKWLELLV